MEKLLTDQLDIGANKTMYVVLKMSENILYSDPYTGEEKSGKIEGIAGYLPCFKTYEEAELNANGNFDIISIVRS
jgi:hypothetical protein